MIELVALFISCGLVISLLFSELFGLAAGGLVVPGYLAFHLNQPIALATTVGVAFVTYLIVQLISSFAIVYGRRRTVLMILTAYLLGMAVRFIAQGNFGVDSEVAIIGFIIPGLIAIWMDRQGIVETVTALATASVITRFVLILVLGGDFQP